MQGFLYINVVVELCNYFFEHYSNLGVGQLNFKTAIIY